MKKLDKIMRENDIIDSSTNPSIWQESREAPQKCVKYSLSYPQIIYKKTLNRHIHMLIEGKANWWYLRGRTLHEKRKKYKI